MFHVQNMENTNKREKKIKRHLHSQHAEIATVYISESQPVIISMHVFYKNDVSLKLSFSLFLVCTNIFPYH